MHHRRILFKINKVTYVSRTNFVRKMFYRMNGTKFSLSITSAKDFLFFLFDYKKQKNFYKKSLDKN